MSRSVHVQAAPVGAPRVRWLTLAAAAILLLAGCEDRARTNPFDPGNPATAGEPRLLEAVAGNRTVALRWDVGSFDDDSHLRLLRAIGAEPEAVIRDLIFERTGLLHDDLLPNGVEIRYRLEILAPNGVWLSSRPDTAMAGASLPWIGDAAGGGVGLLSPDGRDLRLRAEKGRDVLDLEPEPSGRVWIADYGYGAILCLDAEGTRCAAWAVPGANTLALDRREDILWVGSFDQRRVMRYRLDGALASEDTAFALVERVRAARGGGAWVTERDQDGRGRVRLLHRGGVLQEWTGFVRPVGIAVDSSGGGWVADPAGGTVTRLAADGSRQESAHGLLQDPAELDVDGADGAWIADRGRGGIVYLDANLAERAFLPLPGVTHLAWDPLHRRLWAVLSRTGRVEVYAVSGSVSGGLMFRRAAVLGVGGRPVSPGGRWRT